MSRSLLWPLGIGTLALLLATASGHLYSIDGLQYYRVATEIVFDGSVTFDPPLDWGGPITTPITTIGFSLAQTPAVLAAWPFWSLQPPPTSGVPFDSRLFYGDPLYTAVSWVNPAIASVTAIVAALQAAALGLTARRSLLVALAVVFGTPLFFYARADFLQPLVGLLLLAIIGAALRIRAGRSLPIGLLAILVAWAVMTRPPDAAIAVAAAVAALLVPTAGDRPIEHGRRPAMELTAGVIVGLLVSLIVNHVRRGRALDFGYPADGFAGSLPHMLTAELFSPGRGLIWYLPLAVVAAWGAVEFWRAGRRLEVTLFAVPIPAFLVLYGMWQGLGGWAWGPRFLVPLAPLIVLLAAGLLIDRTSTWRSRLFVALGAAGLLANVAHLVVDQMRFWGTYGDSVFGTPGFDRQFELAAFAPIGSWSFYDPSVGPDVGWIREASASGGLSLLVGAALLVVGVACLAIAFARAGQQPVEPRLGAAPSAR